MRTVASLLHALETGEQTSAGVTGAALEAARAPSGEGAKVFTRLYADSAMEAALAADLQRAAGGKAGPLAGIPVSVKDLFDVKGDVTTAGSVVLDGAPPAPDDAPVIARLRAAGSVLVGRTNMTEFAYSGLGINPHYGTPRNPWDRTTGRIPGGSSSGSAVSVADGMCAVAIGTDTGGSVRIPAALCGLAGFKPSRQRIPTAGMLPLSPSLDAVGIIAPSVRCCAIVDSAIADGAGRPLAQVPLEGLRVGILQGYVLDGLDAHVSARFSAALAAIEAAGAELIDADFDELADIPRLNADGGFAAFESYGWHESLVERSASRYDPRVLSRILRGRLISTQAYCELEAERGRIIQAAERKFAGCDVWILPTVPVIAPAISALERDDAEYYAMNAAMLRNPSVFNFLDGCALSIPCHAPGEPPAGIMLGALRGRDELLLRIGLAVERALAQAGCAIPA